MTEWLEELFPYAFFGTVMVMAVAELLAPRRQPTASLNRRWVTNLGLFVVGLGVQRFVLPVSAVVAAETAERSGLGLFNLAGWTGPASLVVGILALDLWKYLEHRLVHAVPVLWRLHLTHHSDVDADFTTTERHHPLEVVFGVISAMAAIFLLGISPLAVIIYLLLASAVTFFSHANIRIPEKIEAGLRFAIVTPGFHNVHHSAARAETDSNYGVLLTVWDRIFASRRRSTQAQEAARVIGLEYFRDARSARFDRVLCQPFLSPTTHAPANGGGSRPEAPYSL
jgi:sterol desaturase/sphingolipid hydroxylase (fatty acid hydroxylase superfamily)